MGCSTIAQQKQIFTSITKIGDFNALDVTQRSQLEAIVKFAQSKFDRVDVLINNAGVMPLSALDQLKVEEWDRMIDVNIKGVLYGIAAVLPVMKAQKSGQIINHHCFRF